MTASFIVLVFCFNFLTLSSQITDKIRTHRLLRMADTFPMPAIFSRLSSAELRLF
jgi:hypothetical protein